MRLKDMLLDSPGLPPGLPTSIRHRRAMWLLFAGAAAVTLVLIPALLTL